MRDRPAQPLRLCVRQSTIVKASLNRLVPGPKAVGAEAQQRRVRLLDSSALPFRRCVSDPFDGDQSSGADRLDESLIVAFVLICVAFGEVAN